MKFFSSPIGDYNILPLIQSTVQPTLLPFFQFKKEKENTFLEPTIKILISRIKIYPKLLGSAGWSSIIINRRRG